MTLRFFLLAIGSVGDTNPMVALGRALRRRGHEVFVLATAEGERKVRDAGLDCHVVLSREHYDTWTSLPREADPDEENVKALMHLVLPSIADVVRFAWRHYQPGRSIAVSPVMVSAGLLFLRERIGLPVIEALYATRNTPSPTPMFNGLFGDFYRSVGENIGLRIPADRDWFCWLGEHDHAVGFYPDWFGNACDSSRCVPATMTGYLFEPGDDTIPMPEALEAFLDAGSPPMAVTFGSYATNDPDLMQGVIDACAQVGRRLVIITRYSGQLPAPLPAHCINVGYVSLRQLFPRLRGVIHHGGAGTIAQAFRAGVPQLVCPMAFDQFMNADRVVALGCGLRGDVDDLRAGRFAETLSAFLGDASLARCARQLAMTRDFGDPVERACDVIETEGHRAIEAGRVRLAS